MIKTAGIVIALLLAGCASKAPQLLYADGSNRIPVNARHGALSPAPAAPATAPAAVPPIPADGALTSAPVPAAPAAAPASVFASPATLPETGKPAVSSASQ